MGTGLEADVHRRPGRVFAALAAVHQRRLLRVQAAELGVEPLANHLAVTDDDGADERIRADPPAPALGQLEGAAQMVAICGCEGRVHKPIDKSVNQELYAYRQSALPSSRIRWSALETHNSDPLPE